MPVFWVVMGAMIALGLVFVLLPLTRRHHLPDSSPRFQSNMLIHRDQLKQLEIDRDKGAISVDEFQSEQQELARRAIEDALAALKEVPPRSERSGVRPVAIALAILVPAAAIGLYLKLGSPDSLAINKASPLLVNTQDQTSPHGMSFDQIRESADKLSARLRENPSDGEGWAMLARSYNVLGRYQEAGLAYEKGASLLSRDAQLLNSAVAPDVGRNGMGRQIVQRLVHKLSHHRRREIVLEVRETNVPPQLFFSNAGFRAVTVLRRHYDDTCEDADYMRYCLNEDEAVSFIPHNRLS